MFRRKDNPMRKLSCTRVKLLAFLLLLTIIPCVSYAHSSAQAVAMDVNTLTAVINDVSCSMPLTSFYQLLGYAPTFTLLDSSGFPVSAITLYIPFDAKTGSVYSSGTDDAYGAAGVAYSDISLAASYSTQAAASEGDNYFGLAGGQTAWTLQIDSVSDDGSIISGQFSAAFESNIWGTGNPATVYDGMFCLDLNQLPAPTAPSAGTSDAFSDSSLDDLLGPIGVPDFSVPSTSGENTPCPICNGTGYKRDCTLCNGLGYGTGADVLYKGAYVCASCLGEGKIICVTCGGDGWIAP
jgi:hypothetical protein